MSNENLAQGLGDAASSRRSLLGKAAWMGLAAVPVVGMVTSKASAAALTGDAREAFMDIRSHENDHVYKIKAILGSKARPKPTFKGLNTTSLSQFLTLSRAFEITGVGAYLGALPSISIKEYVSFAGSVALVEARHAGFLNFYTGKDLTLQAKDGQASAVDRPLTISEVVKAVSPFIASLNGGPAPTFTAGDDVSIVNFALLLEYLEAEFYNINVPKYV
jgi:hypothetical protein